MSDANKVSKDATATAPSYQETLDRITKVYPINGLYGLFAEFAKSVAGEEKYVSGVWIYWNMAVFSNSHMNPAVMALVEIMFPHIVKHVYAEYPDFVAEAQVFFDNLKED